MSKDNHNGTFISRLFNNTESFNSYNINVRPSYMPVRILYKPMSILRLIIYA